MKNTLLLCSFLIFILSCGDKPVTKIAAGEPAAAEDEVVLTPEQMQNASIAVDTPARKGVHPVLQVNGVVDVPPQNVVSITFPLGGYLKTMNLLPGMQVHKGEVLAVLEDPQYIQLQQDYLMARSRLSFLEADYQRQRELNATKVSSDKVFQEARTNWESQQILVHSLREKLALINIDADGLTEGRISRTTRIYAPATSFVTKVNVNKGRYVNPTDVLFELIDPADLHLSLTIFEKDLLKLAPGQKVVAVTNSSPETYEATIHFVSTSIGEDRAGEVHCDFNRNYPNLRPGMFMNAQVQLDNNLVTALPDEAIVKWQEKPYVFQQVAKNRFKMVPVQTGSSTGNYTEIKSELPGGYIVTRGAYSVLMVLKNKGDEG
ncbi:MAG: efflux RND transporter periplasmic adaptor subunit [Williamsia sp.]|nr:efflux RND transporter periplasmic adaptor subunit [Williamsia sp.]